MKFPRPSPNFLAVVVLIAVTAAVATILLHAVYG